MKMTPKELRTLLDLPTGYEYGAMWTLCALGYARLIGKQSYGRQQNVYDVHDSVLPMLKDKKFTYKKRPAPDAK